MSELTEQLTAAQWVAIVRDEQHLSDTVLGRMDTQHLWDTALISKKYNIMVGQYVARRPPAIFPVNSKGHGTYWSLFPIEIVVEIMLYLAISDRIHFGMSCRLARMASAWAMRSLAAFALRRYRLSFSDVNFIQLSTGTIISGSTVTSLLHDLYDFVPADLDFYCPVGSGLSVVRFLELASPYLAREISDNYDESQGIQHVWWMSRPLPESPDIEVIESEAIPELPQINVIESLSDDPLHSVLLFYATMVMGAWTAFGYWHAYPAATLSSLAISGPLRMPVGTVLQRKRTVMLLRKYTSRGYTFLGQFDRAHECGVHVSCPATLRNNQDRGCLFIPFPDYAECIFTRAQQARVSWILGTSSCRGTIYAETSAGLIPATLHRDIMWDIVMHELLDDAVANSLDL
ncbi:hypothetical protein C8J57DRAFT_1517903 [Mycena rebaudengoi]|nr:hypothetical protein C8J57DRAFT_1517903 [Mycena rebaudengoi]